MKKPQTKKEIKKSPRRDLNTQETSLRLPLQRYATKINVLIGTFGILAILLLGIATFRLIKSQTRPTIETPKTEVKKIPADVKQAIKKQQQYASPSAALRVPILMYHYVEYVQDKSDKLRVALNIQPATFDEQVKTLKDAGYTFLTASQLADMMNGKTPLPPKPILITIDDGHWDLYTDILPILQKYQVPATAFIIPGFLGGSDFLTPDQLQKVIDSHLIEIGAHTVHHIALAGKLSPVVTFEVSESKKMLESTYHIPVKTFAYPSGSFDEQAIQAVKNAGFTIAFSTIPGIYQNQTNRFFLYRIRPGYRIGQELLTYLQQDSFRPW